LAAVAVPLATLLEVVTAVVVAAAVEDTGLLADQALETQRV
jgi:hypothetical protein